MRPGNKTPPEDPDPLFPRIKGLLTEDDGEARYAIDAANSYDGDWIINRWTHSKDAAHALADTLATKYGCVRLYEWGTCHTDRGRTFTGWIAFWWSDTDYVKEKPDNRRGIPYGNKKAVSPYQQASRPKT